MLTVRNCVFDKMKMWMVQMLMQLVGKLLIHLKQPVTVNIVIQ